jgi:hypothetical protein
MALLHATLYVDGFLDPAYQEDSRYAMNGDLSIIAQVLRNRAGHIAYNKRTRTFTCHFDTSNKFFTSILSASNTTVGDYDYFSKMIILETMTPTKTVHEGDIVMYESEKYLTIQTFFGDMVLIKNGLVIKLVHASALVVSVSDAEWREKWKEVKREWKGKSKKGFVLGVPSVNSQVTVRTLSKQCVECREPTTTKCPRCAERHCATCWQKGAHACRLCAVCAAPCSLKCSCKKVRYCSVECQRLQRSEHKDACF